MNLQTLLKRIKPFVVGWIDRYISGVVDLDDIADGATYAKVITTALSSGAVLLNQAIGSLDDVSDGSTYGKVLLADLSGGKIILANVVGDLDDVSDGSSYGKILLTDISAGHILLATAVGDLDDIADGGTYGRVLATGISAGKITLSQADGNLDNIADGSTYGKVLTTQLTAGQIVLAQASGDLDDIADGTTYGKVNATILGSGYIQVGSGTKNVNLSGWIIDSTEIAGQSSGTDQVVMNTSGQIVAGAGDVTLDANGITIEEGVSAPNKIIWKDSGTTVTQIVSDNASFDIDIDADASATDADFTIRADSYSGGRWARVLGDTTGAGLVSLYAADNGVIATFTLNSDLSGERVADFQVDKFTIENDSIIVEQSKTPSSASDTGTTGMIAWDSSYIYICTATNTWKRASISTW